MIAMILAFAYVAIGNHLLLSYGELHGLDTPSLGLRYAFLALGIVTSVVVHEGGHRTAGALLGWKCVRFGFGPFEFYRERKAWKRQRVKLIWGAFVRQMPPRFVHYRRQKTLTLVSGSLASLILGGAFVAVALTTETPEVYALFSRLALVTLLGTFELIPVMHRNGIGSDGYRLLQVFRGGEHLNEFYRESMAEATNCTPMRYRDWPRDVVVRLAEQNDPYNLYLAYLHMADSGETEAAAGYVNRLIALLPAEQKPWPFFAYEIAYWLAAYAGDPAAARQWLDRAGRDARNVMCIEAEAAIAAAEGQPEVAAGLVTIGLDLAHDPGECGGDQVDIERLKRMQSASTAVPTSR
jgi:hypothetical protein